MIQGRILWPALALVALLVACTPQDSAYVEAEATADDAVKVDVAAFEQELEALQEAYVAGYGNADAAGLAALFTEDGVLSPPLSPALDRAGIEAMYSAIFESGVPAALEVMREDYVISGDMAIGWGSFQVTFTPADAEPFSASGRYGSVLKKGADGTWKLFRHMFNYEVPPPGFGE